MIFSSPEFVTFLLLSLGIYWTIPGNFGRKVFLLFASCLFYAWWDFHFLALVFASCWFNRFVAGRMVFHSHPATRKRWVLLGVGGNLAVLSTFKYCQFFLASAQVVVHKLSLPISLPMLHIALPLGVSFFTFQGMSFVIDVYRNKFAQLPSYFDFTVYKLFFPQLVAGPIVRASDFLPQLESRREWNRVDLRFCLWLFLLGFAKKCLIGDVLSEVLDPIFSRPAIWYSSSLWFALAAYPIQLYADFSGYTDMALASAGLFGYQLGPNFQAPLLSTSVADYWRRWHISLMVCIRDYLYWPLGGSRRGQLRQYFNLFITMSLSGLWHGAGYKFLAWGMAHGVGLIGVDLWERAQKRYGWAPLPRTVAWGLTYFWVALLFPVFRSPNLHTAVQFIRQLASTSASAYRYVPNQDWWWSFVLGVAALHYLWHAKGLSLAPVRPRLTPQLFAALFGLAVAFVLFFTPFKVVPFVYFQF